MHRRRFLAASIATVAASRVVEAQQSRKINRLAVLTRAGAGSDHADASGLAWQAWRDELKNLGHVEGNNLQVSRYEAEGDVGHIRQVVREILSLKPDVIFTPAQNIADVFRSEATTIPIVVIVADPVGSGFADSLRRPGRNITGFSIDAGPETVAKRFALLKEVAPAISCIAWLAPRVLVESRFGGAFRDAARAVGLAYVGAPVGSPADEPAYRSAFARLVRDRADALAVTASIENLVHRRLIVEFAAGAKLPALYWLRDYVEAGGLLAYTIDVVDIFRGAAGYIARILNGANPAELPFQQPAKFELVVNLGTARHLGLAVPESILARADKVIE